MIVRIVINNKGGTMFQLLTRMSVGTSDTTAISFIKFDAHSPNTANAFAALHTNGSFPANFLDSIAENR